MMINDEDDDPCDDLIQRKSQKHCAIIIIMMKMMHVNHRESASKFPFWRRNLYYLMDWHNDAKKGADSNCCIQTCKR